MPTPAAVCIPSYRHHKPSGRAVVTLNGHDHYLGPWDSVASRVEYDRLVAEWLASGRQLTGRSEVVLTISEMLAAYWNFAQLHYRKGGEPSEEIDNIRYSLRPLRRLYGHVAVNDFGPLALKGLQQRMIQDGLSRGVINSRIGKIKRVFRWAVSEELALPAVYHGLAAVMGLQRGRTAARELPPVKPVPDDVVDATLMHLPPVVAAMVELQRFTGARPTEVCIIRPGDVSTAAEVWEYRPFRHKTEHHGRERVIFIGPQAQVVLRPYLARPEDAYCFSPAESEMARKRSLRTQRKSKVQPSQWDRSKKSPQRTPGDRYTRASYLYAVRRACARAFPAPEQLTPPEKKRWNKEHCWCPSQLRHSAGTAVRRRFGLEGAQLVLGHASADTSQLYAERDLKRAAEIARLVG